jgi:hypothetical protein
MAPKKFIFGINSFIFPFFFHFSPRPRASTQWQPAGPFHPTIIISHDPAIIINLLSIVHRPSFVPIKKSIELKSFVRHFVIE